MVQTDTINVFFSYAPEDEDLRDELEKNLAILKRQGWITSWYRHEITGGQETQQEINAHLEQAHIILLLVSSDFLASDSHYQEMEHALEMRKLRNARVIPVLLRATDDWKQTPVGDLLALPRNNQPISLWPNRDMAFAEIASEIRRVVKQLRRAES